ncbi:hypothetical protein [Legionella cardiaca]|uniref:Uncharacterized protein n=1 Tax=Legionella cardiaca TaxID=1071983 RepID=A0ABY8AV48_9GAMM|nr:hypothetical protein [Legionella cardiaca]WED44565.1 hypothetical protein PXX05_07195 [Legionella cardiaca]
MIKSSEAKFSSIVSTDFLGPIILHMNDENGYGDVSLAIKVAKFLMHKYPNAPIHVIGQSSSFEKIKEIEPDFLDKERYPQISVVNGRGIIPQSLFDSAKLEIETAIYSNSLGSESATPHTKIFIGEYGSYVDDPYEPPVICLSGNIGKKSNETGKSFPGILIEPDLKKFSQLQPESKKEERIKILKSNSIDREPLLRKQLFGQDDNNIKKWVETSKCAFSYYNHPISYKRAAVVLAASNDKDHANYFVSASEKMGKDKVVREMLQEEDFKSTLKALGYSKIVFYDKTSEQPSANIVLDDKKAEGREFRVFQRPRFHHDVTLDLMRLSDICGVAGDQSLTEAISLGAVPLAEEWRCQTVINKQIALTYYNETPMAIVFNNTWLRRDNADIDLWQEAGEAIRHGRKAIGVALTRLQEESNLYNALDYTLNLQLTKPHQEKITEFNKKFIEVLENHTSNLKNAEKQSAFRIATEIACYYAKHKPNEALSMPAIIKVIETNLGRTMSHIPAIRTYTIGANFAHLIRDSQTHSFLKKHITHSPSGNARLASKLEQLHQEYFGVKDDSWLQSKKESNLSSLP